MLAASSLLGLLGASLLYAPAIASSSYASKPINPLFYSTIFSIVLTLPTRR